VTIIDSPAGQVGDRFGAQLAASARRLLIGVPKDDNELGIGGTTVQVDEGRADPFVFDRISRLGSGSASASRHRWRPSASTSATPCRVPVSRARVGTSP
jgi:hypothetical protein